MFQMFFFFLKIYKYKSYNHESARHSVFDGEFTTFDGYVWHIYNISISTKIKVMNSPRWMKSMMF